MIMDVNSSTHSFLHSAIALSLLALVGCGGGSSSITTASELDEPTILNDGADAPLDEDGNEPVDDDLLPDFVILEFNISPTISRSGLSSLLLR